MRLYSPVGPNDDDALVLVLICEEDVPVASAYVCTGAALVEAEARAEAAEAAAEEGSTTEPNAANRVWRPCCVRAESPEMLPLPLPSASACPPPLREAFV